MSQRLGKLINDVVLEDACRDIEVHGVALDSRKVTRGDLFFALSGAVTSGQQFIQCAAKNGAVAAVVDASEALDCQEFSIPVIAVPNISKMAGKIAAEFFEAPSTKLATVAVTGTNGKTSITQMIAESIALLGKKSAVIGTLGNGIFGHLRETNNTTPDAVSVQRYLAEFVQEKVALVAMEASSHGLVQGRLSGTDLDIAVVTNISRDHLDYHGSMAAYVDAKAELVRWHGVNTVILNADDQAVLGLSSQVSDDVALITFSIQSVEADVYAKNCRFTQQGIAFDLVTPEGEGPVSNPMIGAFNIANLVAVAAALHALGYSAGVIASALCQMSQVPGRMEKIPAPTEKRGLPTIVVDFAHTPDALTNALRALKPHCDGHLWCIFGCGGDRDKGKRSEMGSVAAALADKVILTADNPRSERVSDIIQDIEAGIPLGGPYQVEVDREQAVKNAVMHAAQGDVILLAGKGHEQYQEVDGIKHPYSDIDVAMINLQERLQLSGSGDKQC